MQRDVLLRHAEDITQRRVREHAYSIEKGEIKGKQGRRIPTRPLRNNSGLNLRLDLLLPWVPRVCGAA